MQQERHSILQDDRPAGGRRSPYALDYVAAYFRNYAIFGAVLALGLDMVVENSGRDGPVPIGDYDMLPGIPHHALIPLAGSVLLAVGALLCLWNMVAAIGDLYHARSQPQTRGWPLRILVYCAILVGATIPYGLVMVALDMLAR